MSSAKTVKIFRNDGSLIGEFPGETIAEAIVNADLRYADLRSADLRYANLRSADLSYADLRSANLSYADLRSANLSYANLRSADLSYADLSYADLRSANLRSANLRSADLSYADLRSANLSYADLRSANLSYANLRSADLSYADLRSANLSYADLRSANLSYANLSYANLPSPGMVLLASWGSLAPAATEALMRLDASAHPDPGAFDRWAAGGTCPYSDVKVQRAAQFAESPSLWSPGPPPTLWEAMCLVLDEKCPGWREPAEPKAEA